MTAARPHLTRPDPALWEEPEMRALLAIQDVTRLYRLLHSYGCSQQHIAALAGQSQPEVRDHPRPAGHGLRVLNANLISLDDSDGAGIALTAYQEWVDKLPQREARNVRQRIADRLGEVRWLGRLPTGRRDLSERGHAAGLAASARNGDVRRGLGVLSQGTIRSSFNRQLQGHRGQPATRTGCHANVGAVAIFIGGIRGHGPPRACGSPATLRAVTSASGDGGVFINYRGVDTDFAAPLLHKELSRRFGRNLVFWDAESIAPGEDYVERLLTEVRSCAVLLAVIGPQWLTISDSTGRRRIDRPNDWIRRELAAAIVAGITVIPVFTDGAAVPTEADLPPDIAQLGRRQGLPLRLRESSQDLQKIVQAVKKAAPHLVDFEPPPVGQPARRAISVSMLVVVALFGMISLVVSLFVDNHNSSTSGLPVGTGPSTSPTIQSSSPSFATSADPTATTSSALPTAAAVRVWWHGTVTLDADNFNTGWFLDPSPPARAPLGDLGLVCDLSCYSNEVAGNAFVAWDGSRPPERQQCSGILDTQLGQRRLDVRVGSVACLKTEGGRVGYLKVTSMAGLGHMKIEVTVWERPS
ncbi:MAG TPA: toll/interleukin-1 receptor domain-containing protein [Mycobacteriales bacterium]|nr:toll/interleukin-1 receptor domain-containing protein [Mycobacteriales bacterium]